MKKYMCVYLRRPFCYAVAVVSDSVTPMGNSLLSFPVLHYLLRLFKLSSIGLLDAI